MKSVRCVVRIIGSLVLPMLGLAWSLASADTNSVTIVRPSIFMGTHTPGC
jgi:hypothetical protein